MLLDMFLVIILIDTIKYSDAPLRYCMVALIIAGILYSMRWVLNKILIQFFKQHYYILSNICSCFLGITFVTVFPDFGKVYKELLWVLILDIQLLILFEDIRRNSPVLEKQIKDLFAISYIKSSVLFMFLMPFSFVCALIGGTIMGFIVIEVFHLPEVFLIIGAIMGGLMGYLTPIMMAYLIKARFRWSEFKKAFAVQNN